jgi:hypothetical protein
MASDQAGAEAATAMMRRRLITKANSFLSHFSLDRGPPARSLSS